LVGGGLKDVIERNKNQPSLPNQQNQQLSTTTSSSSSSDSASLRFKEKLKRRQMMNKNLKSSSLPPISIISRNISKSIPFLEKGCALRFEMRW